MMRRSTNVSSGINNRDDIPVIDSNPTEQDLMSDDDNAAPELPSETEGEKEDPLILALEDLMGRVVTAIDEVKCHTGIKGTAAATIHEELATLLRPVLEVAAHTGPSIARTYYSSLMGGPGEGVEASCDEVYDRVVSDLVLPFLLEFAQSDTIPAKRTASLEFFHNFWNDCQKAGSWLDSTCTGLNMGPYGSGGSSSTSITHETPVMRMIHKRRAGKKMAREGEILRYWIQASIYCTLPGAFTSDVAEDAVASRGVLAASASLRPALRHIAKRVDDADDRGAAKLYGPVMKMVEGVLKKLFGKTGNSGDGLRSACIKFLEIVAVCCSSKGETNDNSRRRKSINTKDFSIDDLPEGHPIITREALESIAEYAFTTIRGLVSMGGQVKIDDHILSDVLQGGDDGLPSSAVLNVLKPAALAYLAVESSLLLEDDQLESKINRSELEFEFTLSQKPYSLAINAISMLAINRPLFFKEAAICLARRAVDPPAENLFPHKSSALAVVSHLRASCLTLLRNALSVTTNGSEILRMALAKYDMSLQADKALAMAEQTAALKTAGRAARNRAAMFYEWDASEDKRVSKRTRETDDALAKMRAAKAARGLGHGIQLPINMVDGVELVLVNILNLPKTRPTGPPKSRKRPVTFDYFVDAVMTNGASLVDDEGRWYERDGGNCWQVDVDVDMKFTLDGKSMMAAEMGQRQKATNQDTKTAEDALKIFQSQCQTASSQALSRILRTSASSSDNGMMEFGFKVASKLAWTIKGVKPASDLQTFQEFASESCQKCIRHLILIRKIFGNS
jgi:symplekin